MKLFCSHLLLLSVADASDPVLLQYTELPYPDFPQIYLQMEKSHYSDENRQVVVYSKRFCTNYVEVVCISQSQGPFVVSPALTLENLNHYLFSGRENFESNFRVGRSLTHTWQYFQKQLYVFVAILKVLVAGGGIGDSTLFLAEQLNHTNAQVLCFFLFQRIQAHGSIKILHSHDVLQFFYFFCNICMHCADCLSRLLADLSGNGPIQSWSTES